MRCPLSTELCQGDGPWGEIAATYLGDPDYRGRIARGRSACAAIRVFHFPRFRIPAQKRVRENPRHVAASFPAKRIDCSWANAMEVGLAHDSFEDDAGMLHIHHLSCLLINDMVHPPQHPVDSTAIGTISVSKREGRDYDLFCRVLLRSLLCVI